MSNMARFYKACFIFLMVMLLPKMAFASVNLLSDIRIGKQPQSHTRVVLDLAKTADYRTFRLHNPERLVIDISDTENKVPLNHLNYRDTYIKDIRIGEHKNHTLRIVLDLAYPVNSKISTLKANSLYGERILLDLYKHVVITTLSQPVMRADANQGERDVVVVIDPGHGGKDPGATGPGGIHEKDVVLKIAEDLQKQVNQQPHMKAVLTRRHDNYISLRQRLAIARKNKADIFIAIHADAFKESSSHGASVYALSLRGASSEQARWLAEKENYSELGGVSLHDKGNMLRSVLIDLSQTATISSSLLLGKDVLTNIGQFSRLHYRKVEQAAFVVLKSPDIPSILIETGFISNPRDEKNLNSTAYQKKLAAAILKGIEHYFNQRPPVGTYFAARQAKRHA